MAFRPGSDRSGLAGRDGVGRECPWVVAWCERSGGRHEVDPAGGQVLFLLNGPEDRAWGMRTANFQYPDGYVWEIATELPSEEE
jgi:hypothetical protein